MSYSLKLLTLIEFKYKIMIYFPSIFVQKKYFKSQFFLSPPKNCQTLFLEIIQREVCAHYLVINIQNNIT